MSSVYSTEPPLCIKKVCSLTVTSFFRDDVHGVFLACEEALDWNNLEC